MRFLPADLLGAPLVVLGAILLCGIRAYTNRVADGPWTVRLVIRGPSAWFDGVLGWLGLGVLALGVLLAVFAVRRCDPHRWGTVVRYPAFSTAALLLAVGAVLSMWRAFDHVTDVAAGGAQWRFLAVQRTHWGNDLTTVTLALAALVCFALSFGRRRWSDFEDFDARQETRERVPATTAASARMSSTTPTGVTSQMRSPGGMRPPDPGS